MNPVKSIIWRINSGREALRNCWEGRTQIKFPACVRIQDPYTTLKEVQRCISEKIPGIYLRFGDGDVNIIRGKPTIAEQSSPKFAEEMREAFALYGEGIIKCLMIHSNKFGKMPEMRPGEHEMDSGMAEAELKRCFEYFIGCRIYSHAALSYTAVYDRVFTLQFLKFLKSTHPLLVGNQDLSPRVAEQLFGRRSFIGTPSRDAYRDMDRIQKEVVTLLREQTPEFKVCVLSMGCAGRVLAKRIYLEKMPVFFFDFGSLMDAFCGNHSRAWIEMANLPQGYWEQLLNAVGEN